MSTNRKVCDELILDSTVVAGSNVCCPEGAPAAEVFGILRPLNQPLGETEGQRANIHKCLEIHILPSTHMRVEHAASFLFEQSCSISTHPRLLCKQERVLWGMQKVTFPHFEYFSCYDFSGDSSND